MFIQQFAAKHMSKFTRILKSLKLVQCIFGCFRLNSEVEETAQHVPVCMESKKN